MKPILQSHFTEEESKAHRSRNGAPALVVHHPRLLILCLALWPTVVEREDHSGEGGRREVGGLHLALEHSEKGIQMLGCTA